MKTTICCWLVFCLFALPANAGVGDPTIRTDHSHYAGEGAFQTVEDCVRFATRGVEPTQEQAIALFQWLLTHQFHLATPQEWYVPGLIPDSANPPSSELDVYDANRSRFSYGYGLCGSVHAWNEPYWRALGLSARRRAFPGHTNSEVFYDGAWHAFDTDMAGLLFRTDGVVAGYDDITRDLSLVRQNARNLPCYPFAWPSDFEAMKRGWEQVASGGNWYKMYNSGCAAHPGIAQLRSGETFTRYFDPDHFGGPGRRRFWHHQPNGPDRNWTFVNAGTPSHDGERSNSRGNARYCNGEFIYRPKLTGSAWHEGIAAASDNVRSRDGSPRLHSADGEPTFVVFQHFSPYVICGDPADDANSMSAPASAGFVVSGEAVGLVSAEVSADQGQTWAKAGELSGHFDLDLTESVKGRYGWQVRFAWSGDAGLDALTFATTTQVSQAIYPRLKENGSDVVYRSASRAVVPVLPNFGLPESEVGRFEEVALRSANVVYHGRGPKSPSAYRTTNNKPGQIAFRVDSPSRLTQIAAAARFDIRVPPPPDCDFHLEVSTDAGETWREFARADIPADNEFSSGWVYGTADVSDAAASSALVRVHLSAGGYQTGLKDVAIYGIHETPRPGALTVTAAWKEGSAVKQHVERIPAGAAEHAFRVPTGAKLADEFIRLEVP